MSTLYYDPTPAGDWLPLLSLRSDDGLDFCWHDGGPLHVFVERTQLALEDFTALTADAG